MSKPGSPIKTHIIDAVIKQNRYTPKKTIETVEILLEIITFQKRGVRDHDKRTSTSESVDQTGFFTWNSRYGFGDDVACLQSDNV